MITKFGTANIINGYYVITSSEKGNEGKHLHRLIFEEFYKIKLPKTIIIHHDDGNKLNNNIWNLIPLSRSEHNTIHKKSKKLTEIHKKRISQSRKGCKLKLSDKLNASKKRNTTGFYRVIIIKNRGKSYYAYQYSHNNKRKKITRKNLDDLMNAVLNKGLEWIDLREI